MIRWVFQTVERCSTQVRWVFEPLKNVRYKFDCVKQKSNLQILMKNCRTTPNNAEFTFSSNISLMVRWISNCRNTFEPIIHLYRTLSISLIWRIEFLFEQHTHPTRPEFRLSLNGSMGFRTVGRYSTQVRWRRTRIEFAMLDEKLSNNTQHAQNLHFRRTTQWFDEFQ